MLHELREILKKIIHTNYGFCCFCIFCNSYKFE